MCAFPATLSPLHAPRSDSTDGTWLAPGAWCDSRATWKEPVMVRHIATAIAATVLLAPMHGAFSTTTDAKTFTRVEGLIDAATVVRDDTGVPHVFARNEPDLI